MRSIDEWLEEIRTSLRALHLECVGDLVMAKGRLARIEKANPEIDPVAAIKAIRAMHPADLAAAGIAFPESTDADIALVESIVGTNAVSDMEIAKQDSELSRAKTALESINGDIAAEIAAIAALPILTQPSVPTSPTQAQEPLGSFVEGEQTVLIAPSREALELRSDLIRLARLLDLDPWAVFGLRPEPDGCVLGPVFAVRAILSLDRIVPAAIAAAIAEKVADGAKARADLAEVTRKFTLISHGDDDLATLPIHAANVVVGATAWVRERKAWERIREQIASNADAIVREGGPTIRTGVKP